MILSLFISTVLVEGGLRLFHINPTYLEKIGKPEYKSPYSTDKKNSFWQLYQPNDSMRFFRGDFNYERVTNQLGLTEMKTDLQDTSTHKILCLGDSYTEGIGTVADSSWPRMMETYINLSCGSNYAIYNAGVSGSDPVYEYHLLRNKLWETKWDAVIFCINTTDIPECSIRGGIERFNNDTIQFTKPPFWEPLYAASYVVRYLVLNVMHYDWTLRPRSGNQKARIKAINDIAYVLKKADQELRARGIRMMVVAHPMIFDIQFAGYHPDEFNTLLGTIKELKPLDMLPYFRDSIGLNRTNYTTLYWKNDGHFNGTGYRIMGCKIGRELSSRIEIKCSF